MSKPLPDPNLPWAIPLDAVQLIADAEGLRLKAYRCPAGRPTIGYGQTDDVSMGMVWTKEQADADLCRSLQSRTAQVRELLAEEPSDNELGALVSLHYNIGHGAFGRSTVLKCHNRGDRLSAARAFGLWNKYRSPTAGLVESSGLTARRAAEAALYLRPDDGEMTLRTPQAVESESTLSASPIARSGAVAAGVGGMSLVTDVTAHLDAAKGATTSVRGFVVDGLGLSTTWVLPGVLLIIGAVAIWQRVKQRRKGWA